MKVYVLKVLFHFCTQKANFYFTGFPRTFEYSHEDYTDISRLKATDLEQHWHVE